jgi:acyl carrier protein
LREVASRDRGNTSAKTSFAMAKTFLDELLAAATYGEKLLKLETLLRTEVSRVLKLAPDRIGANQPFGQLGIDSLMALEFIRRVNSALALGLPATAVFNYPSINALAIQIAQRLGVAPDAAPAPDWPSSDRPAHGLGVQPGLKPDVLQELSESDALRALMEPGELTSGD